MKKYKIIDGQGMGTHAEEIFDSPEAIRKHLISFHSIDYTGETPLEDYTLEDILGYGEWEIEEVMADEKLENEINKITEKYGVKCVSAIFNIQGTLDIQLDDFYRDYLYKIEEEKTQTDKIEKEIKEKLKPIIINDIYY